MTDSDLAFAGVARQAELVRSGEVSSSELTQMYLERIERLDPQLNAFRVVYAEGAVAQAEQADARRGAGEQPPLLGVPVVLKDNMDLAGEVTPDGTCAYDGPAAADCEYLRRLREAGAVFLGRVLCPELSIMGATYSAAWGITRNPWDPDRTTGGSSGGSGAAIAAGLGAGATASDGAGSIRIPAANCGLYGLKPQRGRVSLAPHREHWLGMSVYGCLTRTVLDTALWLDSTHGAIETDAEAAPPPAESFTAAAQRPPGKLRIALSMRPSLPVPVDSEVRRLTEETAETLRSLGHDVRPAEPGYGDIGNNFVPRYLAGIAEEAARMPHPERLMRRTRGFARLGRALPAAVVRGARESEARHAKRVFAIFDDFDVVLSPATAQPPAGAAEWEGMGALRTLLGMVRVYPYTAAWNALGNPAASVPAGLTSDGLPVAVQLVGRPNDEATLLSLSAQLESERPWAQRRPQVS